MGPKAKQRCAHDGGTCHHGCIGNTRGCWRICNVGPLSKPEPQPHEYTKANGDGSPRYCCWVCGLGRKAAIHKPAATGAQEDDDAIHRND